MGEDQRKLTEPPDVSTATKFNGSVGKEGLVVYMADFGDICPSPVQEKNSFCASRK
jgi:hypothetical protein